MATGRRIEGARTGVTAFVGYARRGPKNRPTVVRSAAEYETAFGRRGTLAHAVTGFFANGGTRAVVVALRPGRRRRTAARLVPRDPHGTGLHALGRDVRFDLVCIPPVRRRGVLPAAVLVRAARFCAARRALLVADAPADLDPAPYRSAADANVALYAPRLRVIGRRGREIVVPASGAVAGVIARTDAAQGIWAAPAGTDATVVGAVGLSTDLGAADPEQGVNALRTLPGGGIVVWGARTLAVAAEPEQKYVNVRRLLLFLEESFERGTGWAVSEPNGEALWAEIRASAEAFLTDVWRRGGLVGVKPEEAFFVRCDRTTMTEVDVDAGRVVVLVGVAALRPAEFAVFRIEQRSGA